MCIVPDRRLRLVGTLVETYRATMTALKAAPGSLFLAALILVVEDMTQQALGRTAEDTADLFTDPIFAALMVWKDIGMWLILLIVARTNLSAERGGRLWRIDRWAIFLLLLMHADIYVTHGTAAFAKQSGEAFAIWLGSTGVVFRIVPVIGSLMLVSLIEARLTTLVQTAWAIGDGVVGFVATWRTMLGNSWRVWVFSIVATLPIMVGHYVLGYAFRGGSSNLDHLAALGFDGFIEAVLVVIASSVYVVTYRLLRPVITPPLVPVGASPELAV